LFTAKVRIALDEKGLDYERIEVGWSLADRYLPHHPEVAALNPNAQVPVLVDGDTVVYDSTQILEYLEDRYPEKPLLPQDVEGRVRVRRFEALADDWIFPKVWDRIEEVFYPASEEGRDDSRAAAAQAGLEADYAMLDAELEGRDWVAGAYSFADISLGVFLNAATTLGVPTPDHCVRAQAWTERLQARPAVARELAATGKFVASLFG